MGIIGKSEAKKIIRGSEGERERLKNSRLYATLLMYFSSHMQSYSCKGYKNFKCVRDSHQGFLNSRFPATISQRSHDRRPERSVSKFYRVEHFKGVPVIFKLFCCFKNYQILRHSVSGEAGVIRKDPSLPTNLLCPHEFIMCTQCFLWPSYCQTSLPFSLDN